MTGSAGQIDGQLMPRTQDSGLRTQDSFAAHCSWSGLDASYGWLMFGQAVWALWGRRKGVVAQVRELAVIVGDERGGWAEVGLHRYIFMPTSKKRIASTPSRFHGREA